MWSAMQCKRGIACTTLLFSGVSFETFFVLTFCLKVSLVCSCFKLACLSHLIIVQSVLTFVHGILLKEGGFGGASTGKLGPKLTKTEISQAKKATI